MSNTAPSVDANEVYEWARSLSPAAILWIVLELAEFLKLCESSWEVRDVD